MRENHFVFLRRIMRLAAVLAAVLALSPAWAGAAASAGASDPARCIAGIGQAMDNADAAAFTRLVDVDALLDQALAAFLEHMARPDVASGLSPMLAMMFSQAAAQGAGGENIRNLLKSEARAFVLNGVSSGAFGGRKPDNSRAAGLLAPLFAGASLGRKTLRNPGNATADGSGYVMPFEVVDEGNGETYAVLGRFSPMEDGVRLTGVENLPELMDRLRRESGS